MADAETTEPVFQVIASRENEGFLVAEHAHGKIIGPVHFSGSGPELFIDVPSDWLPIEGAPDGWLFCFIPDNGGIDEMSNQMVLRKETERDGTVCWYGDHHSSLTANEYTRRLPTHYKPLGPDPSLNDREDG